VSGPRHTLDQLGVLEAIPEEGTFSGICYIPAELTRRTAMRALLFTIAALTVSFGIAQAKPGHGHHGKKAMHAAGPLINHVDHLAKGLELTEAQTTQIAKLKTDLKAGMAEDRKIMHNLHADLRALWAEADLPSREDVEALQKRMHAARDRMAKATLDARFAARGVLNAAQSTSLATHKADYAKSHAGKGQGHHGKKACGGDCAGKGKSDAPCPHAGK
jgi:Spy/CpxP family protein refolding chaperone